MRNFLPFLILMCLGCTKDYTINPLPHILNSTNPKIKTVMDNVEKYEIQIKVSELMPTADTLYSRNYEYQVNDSFYFYPASSVKFPIAALALEKVNSMDGIDSNTPFRIEGDTIISTIRKDVTAIFAVSDNDAYNRLFEFMGSDYINAALNSKGYSAVRLAHRLSIPNSDDLTTKPVIFQLADGTIFQQDSVTNSPIKALKISGLKKGIGYYNNSELIREPMDFSEKNYLAISSLHEMMKRVRYPEAFPIEERFILNKEDQEFLLKSMQNRPREVGYDESEYYDGYVKFLGFGDTRERIPNHLKIFNKVGYAYGYLTDCSLFEDSKNGVVFLITATIHVNDNQIFNDDTYEYEDIGIPFLAELGRQLHAYFIEKKLYIEKHGHQK